MEVLTVHATGCWCVVARQTVAGCMHAACCWYRQCICTLALRAICLPACPAATAAVPHRKLLQCWGRGCGGWRNNGDLQWQRNNEAIVNSQFAIRTAVESGANPRTTRDAALYSQDQVRGGQTHCNGWRSPAHARSTQLVALRSPQHGRHAANASHTGMAGGQQPLVWHWLGRLVGQAPHVSD